jgi:hypothetical protein
MNPNVHTEVAGLLRSRLDPDEYARSASYGSPIPSLRIATTFPA